MSRAAALLLVVGLGAVPGLLHAGVDTAWVRRYDGPKHNDDWPLCIAVDSVGNVYVAGTSMSDTGQNTQYLDFVTIKYRPNGDTAWVRRADFGGKDMPYGLGVDAEGNVYVAGANNDDQMVTVKYDSTGHLKWTDMRRTHAGAYDLVLDSSGGVIVCGRSPSDASVVKFRADGETAWVRYYDWMGGWDCAMALARCQTGDIAVTGEGVGAGTHTDCLTARYDSSGNELWVAGYDGPNHGADCAVDVAVDRSDNTIVAAQSDSGYGTPWDYLTIKYNPQGETLWTRRYDGPAQADDEASAVAVDSAGNVYVTGTMTVASGHPNCATIKYAPDGQQLWIALFGGPIANYGRSSAIALGGDGGVYVCGVSAFSAGAYGDYATIKHNGATGDTQWVRGYNGPGSDVDRALAIAVDLSGCVYVTGESYGGIGTGTDIATIKYVQDGGVQDNPAPATGEPTLTAEPSVVRGVLFLEQASSHKPQAASWLLDVSGRKVLDLHPGANDVRGLSPGVYFVREAQAQAQAQAIGCQKVIVTR